MISIQRGGGGRETFQNPTDPHQPYLYKQAQENRVALERVFASFVCMYVRVGRGDGVKGCRGEGATSAIRFQFQSYSRIGNAQNETIRMKFSTPKQLISWYVASNRRRLRSFIQYMNIRQNCKSTRHFSWMWKFITSSKGQPQGERVWDLLGWIFSNNKHELILVD
jgi:hypothetical protein